MRSEKDYLMNWNQVGGNGCSLLKALTNKHLHQSLSFQDLIMFPYGKKHRIEDTTDRQTDRCQKLKSVLFKNYQEVNFNIQDSILRTEISKAIHI
jgi:hypothetical protein